MDPGPHARHFAIDPNIAFLNHGSFGACPTVVLEAQSRWRALMERELVTFFVRELEGRLDEARQVLAELVSARPEDVVWVQNATFAINSVLRSFPLEPGDQVLTTSHEYNASRNVLDFVADRAGAQVVVADLPFPVADRQELVEPIVNAVTNRTRLLLMDHITSPTGLVLPLEEIAPAMRERGVRVLVDGAHGVGQLPLDFGALEALGVDWYTSNCHKWLCAPKGSAFLWTAPARQGDTRPACISHAANSPRTNRSRYLQEFDWTGTDDPTPYLSVPTAIEFLRGCFPDGLAGMRRHNRELLLAGRDRLCAALDIPPPAPDDTLAFLAALPLPKSDGPPPTTALYADPLQSALFDHGIEVPIIPFPHHPHRLVRISAQIYNHPSHYDLLATTLTTLLPD